MENEKSRCNRLNQVTAKRLHLKFPNRIWFLPCVAVIALSGCYHVSVRGGPRSAIPADTRTSWNIFWGAVDATTDLADCPQGMAAVTAWQPWWGFIPELLTLGFASPWRIEYICSMGAYAPAPNAPLPKSRLK